MRLQLETAWPWIDHVLLIVAAVVVSDRGHVRAVAALLGVVVQL
jgi:hypothetical protein